MAALIKASINYYHFIFHEKADDRVADWFLMGSPFPTLGLLIGYYYFVNKWGPKLMEDRKPLQIDKFMIVYNAVQCLVNAWMIQQAISRVWMDRSYSLACAELSYSREDFFMTMADRVHKFYILKVSDLLDTVFMVLRKNNRQITFLHVYHHMGMVMGSWICTKYIASGHIIFFGTLNCTVHLVMYAYYLLTAYNPEYKKSIWWKRHITELQLLQFFMLLIHHVVALVNPSCNYPTTVLIIYISQTFLMIYLFSDFYYKAYIKPRPQKKELKES